MAGSYDSCAECGAPLTHAPGRGKARKYCGSACQEASDLKRWAARPIASCAAAGCLRPATRSKRTQCETHYYRVRRGGTVERKNGIPDLAGCAYCGYDLRGGMIYCSPRCGNRHRSKLPQTIECAVCKCVFSPFERNLVCSDDCDAARKRAQHSAWRIANIDSQRSRARAAEYKRKARVRALPHDDVDRVAVFERDGWVCQLCLLPVDRSAVWPEPGFASLDHVTPLSKGGAHVEANVQCAHLLCNISKGARSAPRKTYRPPT